MSRCGKRAGILHVRVVNGSGGGPDKTIARSARYLDPVRFEVASAYLHPRGDGRIEVLREAHRRQGQTFYAIAERGAVDPASVRALVRLCRQRRVDVWHGHDYKSDVLGRIVRRQHPMKLVSTVHGFTRETARMRLYAHVDDLVLPGYDHVAAVSPLLVEHCANHGVNPARLSYVPNAIETDCVRRTRTPAEARCAIGAEREKAIIGVVARLSEEKGVDRALVMLAQLKEMGRAVELHVIGDGPQRAALEKQAARSGVTQAVRWWGWRKQTGVFYEAMDLLLLPSRTEGLPNVVLEAMAMQTPVAATRVGAVPQVLGGGRYGLLLEADETTWGPAVAALLDDRPRRAQWAVDGRRRMEREYSFARRMVKIAGIYDRVLETDALAAQRAAA